MGNGKIVMCAECNEEKPHYAKGLCSPCYLRHLRRINPDYRNAQLARTRRWRKEHPDYHPPMMACADCGKERPHEAKGLCKPCYQHSWRQKNSKRRRAYLHDWYQENPQKRAGYLANYRARKAKVANTLTQEQIDFETNIARAMWPGEDLHIHHIVPISKGGGNTWGNIMVIPATLNLSIQNKLPEEAYKQGAFLQEDGIPY